MPLDTRIRRFLARLLRFALSDETDLVSVTLHQLLVFFSIWNILVSLVVPTAGADEPSYGVSEVVFRSLASLYPLVFFALRRFLSARVVFGLVFYWIAFLAVIIVATGGGIYSTGFVVIIQLILGSAIAFSTRFTVVWISLWFVSSAVVAGLQAFGLWPVSDSYRIPTFAALVALVGSILIFGLRSINLIQELKRRRKQLQETTESLAAAFHSRTALRQRQERLFWNLSHELRSPATRIGLLFNAMIPANSAPQTGIFEKCRHALNQLNEVTALSLLLAQLRHGSSYPADERVDVGNVLDEVRAELEFENAEDSGAPSPQVEIQIDTAVTLYTSEDLLHRVLKGLVQSLWTIGPVASIRLRAASEGGAVLHFQVHAGHGSPSPDDYDRSTAMQLVHRLAELHGGAANLTIDGSKTTIVLSLRSRCAPQDLAIPHRAAPEDTAEIPSRLMGHYLTFMSAWGVIWTLSFSYAAGTWRLRFLALGLLISILAAAAKWAHATQGSRHAFRLVYFGATVLLIPVLLLGGGIHNPATYLFATLIFSTAMVYSERTAGICLGATLAACAVMTALQINGKWPSSGYVLSPFEQWMVLIAIGATAALVLIPFIQMHRKILAYLEREKDELDICLKETTKLEAAQREILETATRHIQEPFLRFRTEVNNWQMTPDAPPSLSRIVAESDRLDRVIREMSYVSSLKEYSDLAARVTAKKRVDLVQLLQKICADLEMEAGESDCSLSLHAPPALLVEGSPGLLRSAVENIIRNAIRWTAAGTRIQVDLAATGSNASIAVRDRGPGVPEESLSLIFEPFVQVPGAPHQTSPGVGLGLAIARDVVALHGGQIKARNLPEGGLEVELSIPS